MCPRVLLRSEHAVHLGPVGSSESGESGPGSGDEPYKFLTDTVQVDLQRITRQPHSTHLSLGNMAAVPSEPEEGLAAALSSFFVPTWSGMGVIVSLFSVIHCGLLTPSSLLSLLDSAHLL